MKELDAGEMADLARRISQSRDREAFRRLFDHFAPRIHGYLRKLQLPDGEAEEITQEVMFTLWHKAGLFDQSKSSLSTWLFRIARNRRIDHARRDRSNQLDSEDPMLQPEAEPPPDNRLDTEQRQKLLKEAMEALPDEQYQIIRMAFFMGYSHSMIAEATSLPIGTVKSRIRLAFARLRNLLGDDPAIDQGRF